MPKRSSKPQPPQDLNKAAAWIVTSATGQNPTLEGKNPAAVALGRLGGLKGGKARAAKLSPQHRRQIAQKAAKSRWQRKH